MSTELPINLIPHLDLPCCSGCTNYQLRLSDLELFSEERNAWAREVECEHHQACERAYKAGKEGQL